MGKLFLSELIEAKKSPIHRYGVFAKENIEKDTIIEESPYIEFDIKIFELFMEPNRLEDYFFAHPKSNKLGIFPLGYGVVYNHSDKNNIESEVILEKETVIIKTNRNIKKDEELLIHYGSAYFPDREFEKVLDRIQDDYFNERLSLDEIRRKIYG
jgi:hypothetical protein